MTISLAALLVLVVLASLAVGLMHRSFWAEVQRLAGPLAESSQAVARLDRASTPLVSQINELASSPSQSMRRTQERLLRDSILLCDEAAKTLMHSGVDPATIAQLAQARDKVARLVLRLGRLVQEHLDTTATRKESLRALLADSSVDIGPAGEPEPVTGNIHAVLSRLQYVLELENPHAFNTAAKTLRRTVQDWPRDLPGTNGLAARVLQVLDLRAQAFRQEEVIRGALAQGLREANRLRFLTAQLTYSHTAAVQQAKDRSLHQLQQVETASILMSAVVASIVLSAWIYIHYAVARRLKTMAARVEAMECQGKATLQLLLPETPHDELGVLASALNNYSTALQQRQSELETAKQKVESYVAIVDQHVLTAHIDADGCIRKFSNAFCQLMKLRNTEIYGRPFESILHQSCSQEVLQELRAAMAHGRDWAGELALTDKDGGLHWLEARVTTIDDPSGLPAKYSLIAQDITDHKRIQELSITDSLTGLYNRFHLDAVLGTEFVRAQRYGNEFCVILGDIDHFKQVNDLHGHLIGDEVLRRIARLFRQHCRAVDAVGRWGGEEFMIVCIQTPLAGGRSLAEKLREMVAITDFQEPGSQTMSFGVASSLGKSSIQDLVRTADQLLYASKQAGRNRVTSEA